MHRVFTFLAIVLVCCLVSTPASASLPTFQLGPAKITPVWVTNETLQDHEIMNQITQFFPIDCSSYLDKVLGKDYYGKDVIEDVETLLSFIRTAESQGYLILYVGFQSESVDKLYFGPSDISFVDDNGFSYSDADMYFRSTNDSSSEVLPKAKTFRLLLYKSRGQTTAGAQMYMTARYPNSTDSFQLQFYLPTSLDALRAQATPVATTATDETEIESSLRQLVERTLGRRTNAGQERFISMYYRNGALRIKVNGGLTFGVENAYLKTLTSSARNLFAEEVARMIKSVFELVPNAQEVVFEYYVPMFVDNYGNTEQKMVGTVTMTRYRYSRINWESIRLSMVKDLLEVDWLY